MKKEYLGDSVYVEACAGMITLTTNNGFGPDNTIYLEPEVLLALVEFARRCGLVIPEAKA